MKTNLLVNPRKFNPTNKFEFHALEVWEKIASNAPTSFNFYLWASKRIPLNVFLQLSHEVCADSTIKNKGAVFNLKVRNYLARHPNL